jgi:hypothetical protein
VPSESFAGVWSGALRRTTCSDCSHTVCVQEIDGQRVVTDTERVTIVVTGRGGEALRRLTGRRLHSESCARLARQTERDKIRKERRKWDEQQARKAAADPGAKKRRGRTSGM